MMASIVTLQRMKTGALFDFCCQAGAILGEAEAEHRNRLRDYARDFGLVFQITDDLLDVLGTPEKTGKSVGKDKEQGKATLVSVYGVEGARQEAEKLVQRAIATLAPYGAKTADLRALALFLLDREVMNEPRMPAGRVAGSEVVMEAPSKTPLLDQIDVPADLRRLHKGQLRQLADELRIDMINQVSATGGHLGAGLGVVELTVALHRVFDTPRDKLIWDVGHQSYPHKILTGRRSRMKTLRQGGGLSGFTKRAESVYDTFGAAHSSTSISAGLGFATARDLANEKHHVIAVIGDGAMSAGMAYEAMNNTGASNSRLIVILNDNDMSIAPPVGAMSAYLARLVSGRTYRGLRHGLQRITHRLPRLLRVSAKRAEEYARGFWMGGTLFEELGFYYVGPIDGHNLDHLIPVLENVHNMENGPVLVHVVTQKGKGYEPAEKSADKYHGVSKFNVVTGEQKKGAAGAPPSYTKVFAQALIREAEKDEKVVAITAAMPAGTGLDLFAEKFPGPHLRCRHRRAACGDLCRRACLRGLPALLRHLLDLFAEGL